MLKSVRFSLKFSISLLLINLFTLFAHASPQYLIFTYPGNTSTSLTANWQVIDTGAEMPKQATVYYDIRSHQGAMDQYAQQVSAEVSTIDGLNDRVICRVSMQDLAADTTYYMIVGSPETGYSQEVKVRTIPDDESALRFVTGGDMGVSEDTRTLLRHAASYNPNFAVIGGDIAYANGKLKNVGDWETWLQYYTDEMVTSDGHQIPMLLAIGNHEVRGSYNQSKDKAPFYFGFFGQDPENSYFTRKFGEHFVLTVLDSGHIATHASQVDWLREQLAANRDVTHRAAVYHVPLYPSHRGLMDTYASAGRKYWGPLFDEYELTVAFENHDHTYKRSHPLKDGKPTTDGTGTLFLGDGCWGRTSRGTDFTPRNYLAQSGSVQHFWLVDITADAMQYQAIDLNNQAFDIFPQEGPAAAEAAKVFAAKKQIYYIPDQTVEISEMQSATPRWHGGQSTVTIRNPFDFPVIAKLTPYFPRNVHILDTIQINDLEIQPNETLSIPLEILTSAEEGYDAATLVFWLRVTLNAEVQERALTFETTYGVKARIQELPTE
jgi:hypothetical protein